MTGTPAEAAMASRDVGSLVCPAIEHHTRSMDLLHQAMTRASQTGLRIETAAPKHIRDVVGDSANSKAQLVKHTQVRGNRLTIYNEAFSG